jgi:quinol-cytochrome oxidoreductase complex cytochrome b subunit
LDIDIFGNCDNLIIANPSSTPNHIVPEWYFLLYYSILRAFPSKVAGVVVVIVFLMFIFL